MGIHRQSLSRSISISFAEEKKKASIGSVAQAMAGLDSNRLGIIPQEPSISCDRASPQPRF